MKTCTIVDTVTKTLYLFILIILQHNYFTYIHTLSYCKIVILIILQQTPIEDQNRRKGRKFQHMVNVERMIEGLDSHTQKRINL